MGKPRRGRFITLEGTDGAGKSTQGAFVERFLRERGVDCVRTREPGGSPMGEAIRSLLLDRDNLPATPAAELLLVFAARAQHIAELIEPSLARGTWVLCDRFTDATYAYQGAAGGLGYEAVSIVEQWVQGELRPDLTLVFDVPLDVGRARTQGRGGGADRFESLDDRAKEKIRAAYLDLATRFPSRIEVIDAAEPIRRVEVAVSRVLETRLARWADA